MTRICEKCGVEYGLGDWPFCRSGHGTARYTVRPDTIPGGMVIENLTPQPKRYYSHSEIKHEAEMRGLTPYVVHVGTPGSDKSPHTSRWI